MKVQYVMGDLIQMTKDGEFDVVCHGANCFYTMGAGIAKKLNQLTNGKLLEVDKAHTDYGDINKMGECTNITHPVNGKNVEFINLYTQYTYGNTGDGRVLVHWESLYNALSVVLDNTQGTAIGLPLIGCGLANGDPYDFQETMRRFEEIDYLNEKGVPITITVVEYG